MIICNNSPSNKAHEIVANCYNIIQKLNKCPIKICWDNLTDIKLIMYMKSCERKDIREKKTIIFKKKMEMAIYYVAISIQMEIQHRNQKWNDVFYKYHKIPYSNDELYCCMNDLVDLLTVYAYLWNPEDNYIRPPKYVNTMINLTTIN